MALFRWVTPPRVRTRIGDTRLVRTWCILPRTIGEETRWLGRECIQQVAYEGWIVPPDARAFRGIKWRDVRWVDDRVTTAMLEKSE